MSHRWNCPNDYDAKREGERAYESGFSKSNPYEDTYWNRDRACPDAAEEWDRGYRWAQMREEEQREEEAAQHRAEMRRAEARAEEEAYYERRVYEEAQAQEYYAGLESEIEESPHD